MKNLPLYQNLDTSFVNLSALVRYLRGRQTAARVQVELDGYEAEITLDPDGRITARERDLVAGRIAEGEEAFQRLLIRARETSGAIHVFQVVEEEVENSAPKIPAVQRQSLTNGNGEQQMPKGEVPEPVAANGNQETKRLINFPEAVDAAVVETPAAGNGVAPPPPVLAPLEFSNRVEEKARQTQIITEQDWQTLLELAGELLGAVDQTLAAAGLDFVSAYAKARTEIAADYPFLNPTSGGFEYTNGRVSMSGRQTVSPKVFVASLNESLRRVLEKLGANPRFEEVYRGAVQALLALIHHRKTLYDKFFITPQLEKIVGV